jgi:putative endopeptidase
MLNNFTNKELGIFSYEEMSKKDNVSLNGNLVLGENIADIYGFGICEEVLHDELVKKNILGEEQRKYFKDFFENYCYSWKSKLNNTHFKNVLMNDVHSLAKYRVNGVLKNSKYFQRIYSFEESDSMYNNFFIDIW